MNYTSAKRYLLGKPEAVEDYPFGPEAAVFKVMGRMFALLFVSDGQAQINLKCEPQEAFALRELFPAVRPGYHMNKLHWNTVILDGSIPVAELRHMIDCSYTLVVKKLKRNERLGLEARHGSGQLYR